MKIGDTVSVIPLKMIEELYGDEAAPFCEECAGQVGTIKKEVDGYFVLDSFPDYAFTEGDLILIEEAEDVDTEHEAEEYIRSKSSLHETNMITKELASAILEAIVIAIIVPNQTTGTHLEDNEIIIVFDDESDSRYNIYELAHMAKEWAIKNHSVYIFSVGNVIKPFKGYMAKASVQCTNPNDEYDYFYRDTDYFYADTEPEAIFKAAQWVLEQRMEDEK